MSSAAFRRTAHALSFSRSCAWLSGRSVRAQLNTARRVKSTSQSCMTGRGEHQPLWHSPHWRSTMSVLGVWSHRQASGEYDVTLHRLARAGFSRGQPLEVWESVTRLWKSGDGDQAATKVLNPIFGHPQIPHAPARDLDYGIHVQRNKTAQN